MWQFALDSLKEFLETSTIHGLAYIASAPSKISKGFWFLVVIVGFSSAFYLINDSYNDWQASPVATSISTHPLAGLHFPLVTICPPEGSNTALNYDLVRARNITLTEKNREYLVNVTAHFLIDKPSQDFVHLTRSLLNEKNILEIFERKPTFAYPMAYNEMGEKRPSFEIWSSKLNGIYKTPGFGENYSCNETLQNIHFVLQLPLVAMKKEAGDEVLDFQIEVQSNNDWEIQYREGRKYVAYTEGAERRSWPDAESFCLEKGGHLASVKNIAERNELDSDNLIHRTWIGGTDTAIDDVWVWPDGSQLAETKCSKIDFKGRLKGNLLDSCHNWAKTYPKGGEAKNCLSVERSAWFSEDCAEKKNFACQIDPSKMDANRNQTLKLRDVELSTIELWLQKKANSETETCNTLKALPGFSMTWNTRRSQNETEDS